MKLILFTFNFLLCFTIAAQPRGFTICADTSTICIDTGKLRYDGFYLGSRVHNAGRFDSITKYIDYSVYVPDTTYTIHIFYKNGFVSTISELYDSMAQSVRIRKPVAPALFDSNILHYFKLLRQSPAVHKMFYTNTFAGAYKICHDTIIEQSMSNGNKTFLTFNAFETFYRIINKDLIIETGYHAMEGKYPVRWQKEEEQHYYHFIPCSMLPPLETWIQKKKWIYCDADRKKRKCLCD